MKYVKHLRCTLCQKTFNPNHVSYTCPNCGIEGILEVEFDYSALKNVINTKALINSHDFSMWRYSPLLCIESTQNLSSMLKIGWTPLYRANRLNKSIGINELYIKDESANPSGSTKDRASGIAVIKALEQNASIIACSSTGNAASSLACHASRMGLKTVIFIPKRAPIGKVTQMSLYGATLVSVDGDYKSAYQLSKKAIEQHGWYNRNAAINPYLVEGKKTVALELAEQLNFSLTDWIVVSVGDGCTIAGLYKGFYDLFHLGLIKKIPHLLGVQSEGCAPFYQAYINDEPLQEALEDTIADSIAVGIPRNPIKAMNAVKNSHGSWIAISDILILNAMHTLGSSEGLFAEPAGAASLAGLQEALAKGIIKPDESATIIMTGNGLKDPKNAEKTMPPLKTIKDDLNSLNEYLNQKGVI
jgi:threonine synthase